MSDLYIKENCDLLIRGRKLVEKDALNYDDYKCKILQRLQSMETSWSFKDEFIAEIPSVNLGYFSGRLLTNQVLQSMKTSIIQAFTGDGFLKPEEIFIQDIALDVESVLFSISILIKNESEQHAIGASLVYNTRNNIIIPKIQEIRDEIWL
jgi:hypothetical protein